MKLSFSEKQKACTFCTGNKEERIQQQDGGKDGEKEETPPFFLWSSWSCLYTIVLTTSLRNDNNNFN